MSDTDAPRSAFRRMKVAISDHPFFKLGHEEQIFAEAGITVSFAQSCTTADVIAACQGANALLVNAAIISREVIAALRECRVIVRYGIGVDNIDVLAATERGIAVCNVPDYASGEVADHTIALALTLARQINLVDERVRRGHWRIVPDHPLRAFPESTFVMLGYGRIAREVAKRAKVFGFQVGAHDPFVSASILEKDGVTSFALPEALAAADILSLHLPLTPQTRQVINATSLGTMKSSAIIVNTSRGGLIEANALAEALSCGRIFAAGLDVFDLEPLANDSPLRGSPRTLLTSHVAWYSESSAPRLQILAAQEILRGLRGEPLRSQINLPHVSTR